MDTVVGALAAIDVLDGPALVVGDERVPVRVLTKRHADRRVFVVARERDGDRLFRVRTEWAAGWLAPLVDVADASSADARFEPAGTLDGVTADGWHVRADAVEPPIKG